jgi:hypothetical protein
MKRIIFSFFLLFLSIACDRDATEITNTSNFDELSLNEIVKDYNSRLNDNSNARTSHDKREKTLKRLIKWEQYIPVIKNGEQRIVVPFTLEEEIYTNWMDGRVIPYGSLTSLVVLKANDKYDYEVVTKYPDSDWLLGKSRKFTGQILVEDINGNFVKGYDYKNGEIRPVSKGSSKAKATYEKVCSYIDWYTCGSAGGVFYGCNFNYTEEVGCVELQDQDHDKFSKLDGKWYPNFGGYGGFYNTVQYIGAPLGPGQRLCKSSFIYSGSQSGSFFITNMSGLRFEDGVNVNQNNKLMVFSIANSITDFKMKSSPAVDYFGQGYTSYQYLMEIFPALFVSKDIKSVTVGGQKVWQFSAYAVKEISAAAAEVASVGTRLAVPGCAMPGNLATWEEYEEQATNTIRSFMPGSKIYRGFVGANNGSTNSQAIYGTSCQ